MLAEGLNDEKLVFGEYLGEAVCGHDLGPERLSEIVRNDTICPQHRQPVAIWYSSVSAGQEAQTSDVRDVRMLCRL